MNAGLATGPGVHPDPAGERIITETGNGFAADGFVLVDRVLDDIECERVARLTSEPGAGSAGSRTLLGLEWCRLLARRLRAHPRLEPLTPPTFVATQCTYLEKSPARNWLVPIHQDLSISVAERVEHPQLHGWSDKEGMLFVQAPRDVLEQLVAVRLHLDDCGERDGALQILPKSHLLGRLSDAAAADARAKAGGMTVCVARRGSALAMRPLLLHSSAKASGERARRVLQSLFGPPGLPFGLRWRFVA